MFDAETVAWIYEFHGILKGAETRTVSEMLQFRMSSFFRVALEVNVLVALELQNLTGFIWRRDFK
jgi:hypothetical protein